MLARARSAGLGRGEAIRQRDEGGEAGVAGNSVESVARDFYRQQGRIDATTIRNHDQTIDALQAFLPVSLRATTAVNSIPWAVISSCDSPTHMHGLKSG